MQLPTFPPGVIDNDNRAEMVAPLVAEFAKAYYWGSEVIHAIVGDIIADLGHYLDRADLHVPTIGHPAVFVDDEIRPFSSILDTALGNYDAEVMEAALDG